MKLKKESMELLLLLGAVTLLIAFSGEAKAGAQYGFSLAEAVVVPSLLPLLILFNIISLSGAGVLLQKCFGAFFETVLKLPRCTVGAVAFGLLGGYPTGALLTDALLQAGEIDEKTAARILRFNVNGGAAFIIMGVGTAMLGNKKVGYILFASTTLASIVLAMLSAIGQEKVKNTPPQYEALPFADALTQGAEKAIRSVLCISAYIILFSAIKGIFDMPPRLEILLEITAGTADCCSILSPAQLAAFLAFGGICVHFQLLPTIKKANMPYTQFFLFRVLHAFLSFGICKALEALFPAALTVFSNTAESIKATSNLNTALSILMVLSCAVLILDIENKKAHG